MSHGDSSPPIQSSVLAAAAEWFALLRGEDVTAADRERWEKWLRASPEHRRAWARVEKVELRFRGLPAGPAHAALTAAGGSRRRVLKAFAAVAVGGPVLWTTWRLAPKAEWQADYHTTIGEIRGLRLTDGTRVWLNTTTALNVNYDKNQRRLNLVSGEILVKTAPDNLPEARPMLLETTQGSLRPLGTHFGVHDQDQKISISVYDGSVSVQPAGIGMTPRVLGAGQSTNFTRGGMDDPFPIPKEAPDWKDGMLVANEMRLDRFLDQIARYRRGYLGYTPEAADMRLVGAYPLADTDRILAAVEDALPVRVWHITPWWVRVTPR